jgi:hypothetical protein
MGEFKPREFVRESKVVLSNRLRKEGRWNEATLFKDEVTKELRATKMKPAEVKEKAWEEMARAFQPLPKPDPAAAVEPEPEAAAVEEDGDNSGGAASEGEAVETLLERLAPVDLFADIRWVYSQLGNMAMCREKSPSTGAWNMLEWARKYQSRFFEQLLPKALAKGPEDEAVVKREKRRVEEIESMLEKLAEDPEE